MMKNNLLLVILIFIFGSLSGFAQTDTTKVEKIEDDIFDVVEQQPQFPGGVEELYKYIAANFKYPKKCKKKNHTGKVYVQFVVDKDGSIINAKVLRGIDIDLDNEALRVIKMMPKWTPGKQRGKNVKVRYNLPIVCTLK